MIFKNYRLLYLIAAFTLFLLSCLIIAITMGEAHLYAFVIILVIRGHLLKDVEALGLIPKGVQAIAWQILIPLVFLQVLP